MHSLIGVGLRTPHLDFFEQQPNKVGWLEIHSENYFQPNSPIRQQLNRIAEHAPISCHGIGLSLGSVAPVSQSHLKQLVTLIKDIDPILVSDHLSWSENGGHHFNDLLPLPYTEEALEVFCRNTLQVQDAIGRPLLIENPSSYLSYQHSTIPEWEFLNEVQRRTDCELLLDLNNIYVSAFNHGFSALDYLNAINAAKVNEIHLAGFCVKALEQGEIWIDTHSKPVHSDVWALFQHWLTIRSDVHTLIEWDLDIPDVDVLIAEANKANDYLVQQLKGADHELSNAI
ncbi:DUF692 domain-containing protein [Vibrio sp. SCSIO 43136]|uniref:MNIO family bufferin maturase n=1 Tax=Vibrio sp. SCSIO 43136 TaxID=2819101 RepID=UPI002074F1FD|nr:DUF692 domain-containing protein [Vibrio sp. SCSIO 43136]USD65251.1 DUF692 domain-containing protein [Vibrio sp. SCSIO 43136]